MGMQRRRLAALAFVLAPLVAACGQGTGAGGSGGDVEASADEDRTGSLADLIRSSATKASGIDTSRFSITFEAPGGVGGFSGVGALDTSAGVMTMEIDASGMTGQETPPFPAVLSGDAIYYRFPEELVDLGDRPWVKLDVTQLGKLMGMDGETMMDQFEQSDPKSSLSMMIGVSEDVEELLREDVRGVSTRHFKATIDMNKAIRNVPEGMRGAMEELANQMAGNTYPAEMWIGDDELPRRFRAIIDIPEAGGEMVMDMEYFDYGIDVDAEIPPADQTMDWYEFMGRSAAG